MKNNANSLFQIGEVIQMMGITRKTLMIYEKAGLLKAAYQNEETGYRYYSADDLIQIRTIRSLQAAGLTLKEISDYLDGTGDLEGLLEKLLDMRENLDKSIQRLQVRLVKPGDLTVRETTLLRQVCFARQVTCPDVSFATAALRDTYIAAAHAGKISLTHRMFTMRIPGDAPGMHLVCCIPVEDTYQGPNRMEFPETAALCVYHRGAYEQLPTVTQALLAHLKEHKIQPAGPVRAIYLEGPPNRGSNTAEYITQLAVPIQK